MSEDKIDIEVYRRALEVIQAMHSRPWWRFSIWHRKPWKSKSKIVYWEYLTDLPWYLKGIAVISHTWQWFTKAHDCSDPMIGCSCHGGFRFPSN